MANVQLYTRAEFQDAIDLTFIGVLGHQNRDKKGIPYIIGHVAERDFDGIFLVNDDNDKNIYRPN